MDQFDQHFTLDEANALIPFVRQVFARVHQISATVPAQNLGGGHDGDEDEAGESASLLMYDHEAALRRGYHPWVHNVTVLPREAELDAAWRGLGTYEKMELIGGLIQVLVDKGIVIQDVARGLIDFPAMAGDEEVLLCYELKDGARIVAWHGLHSGFAGRRAIEEWPE